VVLSSKEKLSINVIESEDDVLFIEDGIKRENILKNDHLIFNIAERDAKLIRLKEKNFYLVVNSKFNWGT